MFIIMMKIERQNYALIRALIRRDKRIYGYDNLSGWHCHPPKNLEKHIFCKKPYLEEVSKDET